jgi:hypothetical protein
MSLEFAEQNAVPDIEEEEEEIMSNEAGRHVIGIVQM